MGGKPRIENALDARVPLEDRSDLYRVDAVLPHPERERLARPGTYPVPVVVARRLEEDTTIVDVQW